MPSFLQGKLKIKKEFIVVVILLIAVVLIALTNFSSTNTKKAVSDTEKYERLIENKLENSISQMDGVKKVTVAVKVDGSITTVIAEDLKTTSENGKTTTTSTPVLVNGKPIILGEIYPKITGVVIVCNCKTQLKQKWKF